MGAHRRRMVGGAARGRPIAAVGGDPGSRRSHRPSPRTSRLAPGMRVLALPTCPACGSSELAGFALHEGHRLQRCMTCATVSAPEYVDPAEVYVDGYMFGQAGRFGLDVRAPSFQAYLRRVTARRVRIVERATAARRPGDWLDVGAGTGEMLAAARDRGWRVQGVEPERTAAATARGRGLAVVQAELEASGLPERSFDVVSAFHVLEHIPDSRAFLRRLGAVGASGRPRGRRGAELRRLSAPPARAGLAASAPGGAPRPLHPGDAGGDRPGRPASSPSRSARRSTSDRLRTSPRRCGISGVPPDGWAGRSRR